LLFPDAHFNRRKFVTYPVDHIRLPLYGASKSFTGDFMKHVSRLALLCCFIPGFSVAMHSGFGSLDEVIQAAINDNAEPNYIVNLNRDLFTNKLLPYQKSLNLQDERARLLYLLTMRSYNSLSQITGQRTAILYFYKDRTAYFSLADYKTFKVTQISQAQKPDEVAQSTVCLPFCCPCIGKKTTDNSHIKESPTDAAQDAALAAGLNNAAWNEAWLYGGDPWGPSWDKANDALLTYFDEATNIANSQIERALVGITDPIEQGRIAYRVAEWVALNHYYAKAIEMFSAIHAVLAANLPQNVKNPTTNKETWWRYRSAYFTPLRPISYVYVAGWLHFLDKAMGVTNENGTSS
jgi:hypothetical protein